MKEKKRREKVSVFYWILLVIVFLVFFAVLELSKNTLLGWGIALGAVILFVVLELTVLKKHGIIIRMLSWLVFFALLGVSFFVSQPPYKNVPAVDVKSPEVTEIVTVSQGALTGVYNEDKSVEVFAGIPYAKPPVDELRWKEPQEPESWDGVLACDKFAPMSMQSRNPEIVNSLTSIIGYNNYKISLYDNYKEPVSEDSLYLNIWKPAGDIKDAPVLVFIHGGYLTTGQPSFSEYRGESLAKKGIIVVNFAYRLGVFGYMANEELAEESPNGTTGNYGLLDQIEALKWVNKNIRFFGGDASKVTIAGESAGSSSVNALCVSPLAKGLFRYAIGESSGITPVKPYHTFRSFDEALESGKTTLSDFGAKSVEELRALPAEQLVTTTADNSAMTVDGYAITEQPYLTYEKGNNNEQALLNGYNSHEANVFSLFKKVDKDEYEKTLLNMFGDYGYEVEEIWPFYSKELDYKYIVEQGGEAKGTYDFILGSTWFGYSHKRWSDYVASQQKPVFFYYFNKDNKSLRANHGGEMPYAYGNLDAHRWLYDESDYALSETMMDYWVNFVTTGDPNGGELPEWTRYNEANQILELNDSPRMIDDPYNSIYPIIDKAQNEYRSIQ